MANTVVVNGVSNNSLLYTNIRTSDIRICDADTDYEKRRREEKENLLAEIKRRTEENTYKV
jgi:hypothetical protein